jgi:hypothetical protein
MSRKPAAEDEQYCNTFCDPMTNGLYKNPYYNAATCPDFLNFSVCNPLETMNKNFKSQMKYAEKVVPLQFASQLMGFGALPPMFPSLAPPSNAFMMAQQPARTVRRSAPSKRKTSKTSSKTSSKKTKSSKKKTTRKRK